MSEQFKNQHIVPVSYLNHFGTKQKSGKYLIGARTVKDNKLSKPFRQSTENVGYICNYYDVPEREDPKHWEHFLDEKFDRLCGQKLEHIIAHAAVSPNKTVILDDDRKDLLSKIIISQILRVPDFFDFGYKKFQEVMKKTKGDLIDTFSAIAQDKVHIVENLQVTNTQQKDMILTGAFDERRFEKYCNILKTKVWVAFYNCDYKKTPFVTCDNPVLVINQAGNKTGVFVNGLIQNDTFIFFPVSPAVMIAIYSPTILCGGISLFNGMKVNLTSEEKFVSFINRKLINQAFKHVFTKE